MVRRPLAFALAAVLVAGLASSCSSGDDDPAVEASTTTSTTAKAASSLQKGDAYVALGSSIASGFGIAEQSTTCGRSSRDYGQLVATKLGLKLTDVSCGAAVIANVLDTKQGDNAVQLDAVTADTKLVTFSGGGNDIGFNGTALFCSQPDKDCQLPPDYDAKLAGLPASLRSLIEKVKAKAPDATIVFVTYPREIPEENCPDLSLTDAEFQILTKMGSDLEKTFVDVLGKSDDVLFVDPYVAEGNHTGCAPEAERWVNGAKAAPGGGFALHPTALGHQVMADMIVKALQKS
jgi:lysophospholipase L1-like esterase